MAISFPVCIFPPARFEADKMFAYELNASGEVVREGWIACPGIGIVPALLGPDGAFYFARVEGMDGTGITLYRSELVAEELEPVLEALRVVDLDLPNHLPAFFADVPPPSVIWHDSQAAMIGYAAYSYDSGGTLVQNGVAYCSTPSGLQSIAAVEESAWRVANWFAAVEFDDGAFSTFAWGVAT